MQCAVGRCHSGTEVHVLRRPSMLRPGTLFSLSQMEYWYGVPVWSTPYSVHRTNSPFRVMSDMLAVPWLVGPAGRWAVCSRSHGAFTRQVSEGFQLSHEACYRYCATWSVYGFVLKASLRSDHLRPLLGKVNRKLHCLVAFFGRSPTNRKL